MKYNNKIKKISIYLLTSIFLFTNGFKLIKTSSKVKTLINNHKNSSNHSENIVAHRGFSGLYQSNSYEAILNALSLECVSIIEIDIRLTKDKNIVLSHNNIVSLDNKLVKLSEFNLNDIENNLILKNLELFNFNNVLSSDFIFLYERYINKKDNLDQSLITLNDFFKWYSFKKLIILDIKCDTIDYDFMYLLNDIISNYQDLVYIQSTNYFFLDEMYKLYPNYKYLFIIDSKDDINLENNYFYGYTVKDSLLSEIEILKDKMYLVYTINSSRQYEKLLENKNYSQNIYIITDNPDYICSLSEFKILRK